MNGALYVFSIGGSALLGILASTGVFKSTVAISCTAAFSGFLLGIAVCVWTSRRLSERIGHLFIERATWGYDRHHELDMTDRIRGTVCNDILLVHNVNNTHMQVDDPAIGKPKKLTVWYSYSGVPRKKMVKENAEGGFRLP